MNKGREMKKYLKLICLFIVVLNTSILAEIVITPWSSGEITITIIESPFIPTLIDVPASISILDWEDSIVDPSFGFIGFLDQPFIINQPFLFDIYSFLQPPPINWETIIPEPATILLLTFGGLLLRKK